MESILKTPSVIFSKEIDHKLSVRRLHQLHASELATKAMWLLRESSVPGLLTVTFFDAEANQYFHWRVGYMGDKWSWGPADRSEAILFSHSAQRAFRDDLPDGSAAKLFALLSSKGFKQHSQVTPNAIEATRTPQYSRYVHFITEEPEVVASDSTGEALEVEAGSHSATSSTQSSDSRYSHFG